jgi:hypothetical protein
LLNHHKNNLTRRSSCSILAKSEKIHHMPTDNNSSPQTLPHNFDPAFNPHTSEVCSNCSFTKDEHILIGLSPTVCNRFKPSGVKRTVYFCCATGSQGPRLTPEQEQQWRNYWDHIAKIPDEPPTDTIRWRTTRRAPIAHDSNVYSLIGADSHGNDLVAIVTDEVPYSYPRPEGQEMMMCSPHVYFISDKFVPSAERRDLYCRCRDTLLLMKELEEAYIEYTKMHQ